MREFIESLYRLYEHNEIQKQIIDNLLSSRKINQQEYDYIISAQREVK